MRLGAAVILGLAVTTVIFGACGGLAPEITSGAGAQPACETPDPLQGARATIFPPSAGVLHGQSQEFSVQTGPGGVSVLDLRASWSVDGGDTNGKIVTDNPSATARYQAPTTVLASFTTTVRARLVPPNNTICASATVTVKP